MSETDLERDNFIKDNINNIRNIELEFLNEQKMKKRKTIEECRKIRKIYTENCDKSEILSKIREFYDKNWYKNISKEIDNLTDSDKLVEIMKKIVDFKNIYKMHYSMVADNINDDLSRYIETCVSKRIEYKYYCIDPKHRDWEILRNIYYKQKYKQLKELISKINNKHEEIRERERRKIRESVDKFIEDKATREKRRRIEDEIEKIELERIKRNNNKYTNNENEFNTLKYDQDGFTEVTYKKKKIKRTRIKRH